jgi:pilus assembly protein Flp/PilA
MKSIDSVRESLINCGRRELLLSRSKAWFCRLLQDEDGASLVEYILLVALIAVVCIVAVTLLGRAAGTRFNSTANALNSTPGG